MKKLMLATALLASSSTFALETQRANMVAHCAESKAVIATQAAEYDETPIIIGRGVVSDPAEPQIPGTVVIWRGDDGSFSITMTPDNNPDITCYLVTGADLELIDQ